MQADPESRGDEPEVPTIAKNAAKLAFGRAAKAGTGANRVVAPYTGERRDVAKHIENAFKNKEEGTFLAISEIRNERSDEYGDDAPSAGAISARLFPPNDKPSTMLKYGIRPDTQNGKKGAVKDSSVAAENQGDAA
jgi:hypothetical protein